VSLHRAGKAAGSSRSPLRGRCCGRGV